MDKSMTIREATAEDLDAVLAIERAAFDSGEEADLVQALLSDESARPILSLLAFQNETAAGHILFTRARLDSDTSVSISVLAPLAIVPDHQKQGIGGQLIAAGLDHLRNEGVGLVFVLGHPDYYPRSGFQPAGALGYEATYPILEKNAGAWMVQELRPGIIGSCRGRVLCADTLNRAEYWVE